MKEQIEKRIAELKGDERYQLKPALVQVNDPLALIQMGTKGEILGLQFARDLLTQPPSPEPSEPCKLLSDDGMCKFINVPMGTPCIGAGCPARPEPPTSEPGEPEMCPWCGEEGLLLTELDGFTAYSCEHEKCYFDQWTVRWAEGQSKADADSRLNINP